MNQVPSANPASQQAGLKCPECGTFIPTTIFQLLTAQALVCPHCRLRLSIDRGKSRSAFEVLRNVQLVQKNLEEKSHFNR